MANYDAALSTRLGDFLVVEAAKRGLPLELLAKSVTLSPLKAMGSEALSRHNLAGGGYHDSARHQAIEDFNGVARAYDAVVELFELSIAESKKKPATYVITGTGIMYEKTPEKKASQTPNRTRD